MNRTRLWGLLLAPFVLLVALLGVDQLRVAKAAPFDSAVAVVNLKKHDVSSGAPILSTAIAPGVSKPEVAYAVTFKSNAATTLWVRETYTGGVLDGQTDDWYLNSGTAAVQSAGHTFTFGASRTYDNNGDGAADGTVTYNFVCGTSGTISLHVTEVRSDVR